MGHLALFAYTSAVAVPLSAWRAYAGIVLWGWFITPLVGPPPPSLWMMAGLMLFASLLTTTPSSPERTPFEQAIEITLRGLLLPAFAIAFGFLFKALA